MAASRRETAGEHRHDVAILVGRQVCVRIGAFDSFEQLSLGPFAGSDFGNDLLREYVERLRRNRETIELAAANRIEQRRAFDELVARQRKDARFRYAADLMARSPRALQKRRDRP